MQAPHFRFVKDYLADDAGLRSSLCNLALQKWARKDVYVQPCKKRGYFNLNEVAQDFSAICNDKIKGLMADLGVDVSDYAAARHFVGINTPTAFVTPHTDSIQFCDLASVQDPVEIRFNTFLQKPDGGGVPIIDGELVPVPEGYALAFNAGVTHSTTPVEGSTTRVVLSISAAVSRNAAMNLLSS